MRYVAKNPNERMSRQAIETLNEVKDDVKHGDMIHAFKRLHITDGICPTLTTRPEGFKTASLVVEDINEKERDNLAKSIERYVLDEQADFTQTEAEDWATEIAIRIQEGNLDSIPKNEGKQFEQYDFTYVSLFSGIGGFEQALNKLGGTCVFASEFDKFAQQSYTALYGDEHLHGDITKIDEKDVPEHDLLVGGFPCQSFSVAGKRKGFDDTRGTLFFEIARIAAEKKPKALLLENVKGLINHDKGNTLDTMIKTLNDIGYVVDFDVLNSKYFGVPQNRERIFIVAIRKDLVESEPFNDEATTGNTIVPKGKRRIGEWADVFNFDWPEQNEVSTRLRDILESNVDEKYYLDEEKTAKLVAQLEGQTEEPTGLGLTKQATVPTRLKDESNTLAARDYKGFGNQEMTSVIEPQMLGHVDIKGNDSIKRTYSTEGISPTLTTMGGGHREPKIAEEQGLPIREATKKGYAIAEEGDSVNVQFPDSKTRRGRVGKQIANTLEASSINQGVVESPPKYRIRKLTPLECWRLQGFSDEAHEAIKQAGLSDSQRYKQAGNAVTVNVIEAIGERLIPLIADA